MEGLTEEQEMQRAIQMSMGGGSGHDGAGASTEEAMNDPDFMNSVLGSLSGVDPTDPRIQNVLQGFSSASNNSSKEEEDRKRRRKRRKSNISGCNECKKKVVENCLCEPISPRTHH